MKRTFACVLTFILVLSLAVPALAASGWDKPVQETQPLSGVTISAKKYEYYPSVSGGYAANGQYFRAWDDSKGIVRDTRGRVVFTITMPDEEVLQELYPGVNFGDLILHIKITNVKGVVQVDLNDDPVNYMPEIGTDHYENNIFTLEEGSSKKKSQDSNDREFMFVFSAAGEGDVVASISLAFGSLELGASFMYQSKRIDVYQPNWESEDFDYGEWAFSCVDDEHNIYDGIVFDTDDAHKILRLHLARARDEGGDDTDFYQVLVDVNGRIAFKGSGGSVQEGDDGYADLKAQYDFFMGALGFAWDGNVKYMNEQLILDNLIQRMTAAASVTFPGGHQAILTPLVAPPQTGDVGTLAGFGMLILAAAAVVFALKKSKA